jgi:hypothetical protein
MVSSMISRPENIISGHLFIIIQPLVGNTGALALFGFVAR